MNTTEKVFYDNVSKYLDNSKKIIIAFSGGCDSLCLLALACRTLNPNNIIPVYVNHNLRPEEELKAELELNNKNCLLLGVQMRCVTLSKGQVKELSVKRGGGLEEAARILRYQALEELRVKENACCIMTAHHRQDQLETIAMRIENGSPFTSLKGIASYDEKRHLLRPLLDFDKKDLEDYLVKSSLKWSTDSTNADVNFTRNKMRNEVLPELTKTCPNYDKILLSLHEQACKVQEPKLEIEGNSITLNAFENLDTVQRSLVLYKLWDKVFVDKELSETFVSRVLEAISEKKDCSVGASNAVFSLYRGYLYLTCDKEDPKYLSF
ncbi:MAG: tRNA lysidine(34) synthetase TilS [Sphaerochaetaceae bacterium]|nr:tRNA lysidine(34) synthetase TilS [Sphaerochaetaceae bacterium]